MTMEEGFRFSSKGEYEEELQRILKSVQDAKRGGRHSMRMKTQEEKYEELIEEYLRFCGEEGGG